MISKSGPASVSPPESVTYVIHVTNHGPAEATEVTVADTTTSGLMFVGNTGDCTTTFPCVLGTIPAGQTRTILTTFAVPLGYAGPDTISNTATVVTTATDVDLANNSRSRRRSSSHRPRIWRSPRPAMPQRARATRFHT